MLYFTIFVIIFFLGFLDLSDIPDIFRKVAFWIIIFIFCILTALRWKTGTDWTSYYTFFNTNNSFDNFINSSFEFGYAVLSYISKSITKEYSFFLAFFGSLTIFIKGLSLSHWRYQGYLLIALLIFYSYHIGDIFSTRQSLALSITLFSGKFLIERKLIPFVICVYLASLFHNSSIIFLLAYPISKLNLSTKMISVLLIGSVLFGFFLLSLGTFEWLSQIPFLTEDAQSRLDAYSMIAGNGQDTTGGSEFVDPKTSFLTGLIRKVIILIPILIWRKQLSEKFEYFNTYFNLIMFGAIFYFIFGTVMQVLKRGASYYDIFEILVIPMFIFLCNNKWQRVGVYMIITLYSAAKLFMVISYFKDLYIPFNTLFDTLHRYL